MSKMQFNPTDFPQLRIHDTDASVECRVYNWTVRRDISGKVIEVRRGQQWWWEVIAIAVLSYLPFCIDVIHKGPPVLVLIPIIFLYGVWRCSAVRWESVIVIPPHGIQIEVHRGIWGISVFVSRKFIPTFLIRDVIINEALRRWNVVYYLSVLSLAHTGEYKLDVLFENTLPEFRVLQKVRTIVKQRMLKGS